MVAKLGFFSDLRYARKLVLLLVVFGFAVRLGVAIWGGLGDPPIPGSDGREYDTYAWNLAQGNGYRGMSPDVADPNHLTAYRLPGPSMMWAALYEVFGHRYDVIRIANCLLGALAIWLVFEIGRLAYSIRIGLLSAAAYSIYPTSIVFAVDLMSEPPGTFFFLAFMYACLVFGNAPKWTSALAAGALLGVAIYMRANTVLMFPLLGLWIVWQFRRNFIHFVQACAIPAIAIAMLVPWTIRNYVVMDAFIPLSTMGGSALLQGNNDIVASDPRLYGYNIWDTNIPEYREALQSAGDEVTRDRLAGQFAVEWIKSHPEKWGYLIRMKLWRSLTPFLQPESPPLYRIGMLLAWGPVLVTFGLAFIPTLVGFLRSNSPAWLLHLGILHYLLISVIFFALARYRQPVEPLCIILGLRGIEYLYFRWRNGGTVPSQA